MKRFLIIVVLLLSVVGLKAQSITHIEATKNWYSIYDVKGNKTKALSEGTVGKVLSVSGETFNSQVGSWIYTWSKEGKKINTRSER